MCVLFVYCMLYVKYIDRSYIIQSIINYDFAEGTPGRVAADLTGGISDSPYCGEYHNRELAGV